eukprot:scaffold27_cov355-Prasinococcus_capsulatus_cf.AAC.6
MAGTMTGGHRPDCVRTVVDGQYSAAGGRVLRAFAERSLVLGHSPPCKECTCETRQSREYRHLLHRGKGFLYGA